MLVHVFDHRGTTRELLGALVDGRVDLVLVGLDQPFAKRLLKTRTSV